MAGVGHVKISILRDAEIVRLDFFGDDCGLAVRRVGRDLFLAIGAGVEFSVRAKLQTVRAAGVFREHGNFSIETDLVNATVRNVGEEDLALRVDCRAFGELVAFADELPALAREEHVLHHRLL